MNGAQDMGGQMGFGPVKPERGEPCFHAAWERRALAVTIAMGATGSWSIDRSRHARETLPPADYLASSYYEIWIRAVEKLALANGLVTRQELTEGRAIAPPAPVTRVLQPEQVAAVLAAGSPCSRPLSAPPRFRVGDAVRTKTMNPTGHTRLPRYVRGHIGRIVLWHGGHVFPDSNAHGAGEAPQHLYTVAFEGHDIWGADAEPGLVVSVDAFESYLEAVATP